MTNNVIKYAFIFSGAYLILHAFMLYYYVKLPKELGLIFNMVTWIVDIGWTALLGLFVIVTGLSLKSHMRIIHHKIIIGGYCVIFTFGSIFWSLVYNSSVGPYPPFEGRIFSFHMQTIGELLRPSFDTDFLIVLGGIVSILLCCVFFHYAYLRLESVSDK
ncbi:MAG: hypothetical protein MI892_15730 [Desulfobacterales bacterium]|nr:hypothetical protein [Desulfobacterales bacterium]